MCTLKLETFIRPDRTGNHLIHRFTEIQHLVSSRSQPFDESTLLKLLFLLSRSSHVKDLFLSLLPSSNNVVERSEICRGGGLKSEELDEAGSVLRVFYGSEFEGYACFEVELVKFGRIFSRELGE